jgi:hypothetical protein
MSGLGSSLLLPGDGGSLELGATPDGPRVLCRASGEHRPGGGGVVYLGGENLEGFPPGSLVLQAHQSEGELSVCLSPEGEVTLDLESAGREPVRLGP